MANLETLTIEINANAGAASQGIADLTTKIGGLGQAISNQIGALKEFAATLKEIRSSATGGNIWKNITPPVSDVKKATTAVGQMNKAWAETHKVAADQGHTGWQHGEVRKYDPFSGAFSNIITKNYTAPASDERPGAAEVFKNASNSAKDAKASVSEYNKEMDTTAKVTDKVEKSTNELAESTKTIANAQSAVKHTASATRGLLSQIGRIAKTMLIRTAIRSLMKVAKQGLQNYYKYSKSISGAFYQATQSIQINAATAGNQIGAMLGSLLAAISPILNAILSLVSAVAEALTMLFALFGGSTTYSKATNGFDSIGKSAGGAGGKIKELLADFDELNIIAQESGGGGGGATGDFGFSFKELELPQWMIEWAPVLEALVAGTIGAIVLPKIFSGLKKIIDLFTGGGASNILRFFKYLFGHDPDGDGDLITDDDLDLDIKGLGEQAATAAALAASLELARKEIEKINKIKLEIQGLSGAAASMGVLAGAATLAAPAISEIAAAIEALKAGNGIMDVLGTLITSLLSGLLGGTKIKVDRKEFDKFKKDFDEWNKQNKEKLVKISFDPAYFQNFSTVSNTIDKWLTKDQEKKIKVNFQAAYYKNFITVVETINKWVNEESLKEVKINFQAAYYNNFITVVSALDKWAEKPYLKEVNINFNPAYYKNFITVANALDVWAKKAYLKEVNINFNSAYYKNYTTVATSIDKWAGASLTKWIYVNFNAAYYKNYTIVTYSIDDWVSKTPTKYIKVMFDSNSLKEFNDKRTDIDSWVKKTDTKIIEIREDKSLLDKVIDWLVEWLLDKATKVVSIYFNVAELVTYTVTAAAIDAWASTVAEKKISISFDTWSYATYLVVAASINTWANTTLTKTIIVSFNSAYYAIYVAAAAAITLWGASSLFKNIYINVDQTYYGIYNVVKLAIDSWCSTALTKTIYINVDSAYYAIYALVAAGVTAWAAAAAYKNIYVSFESTTLDAYKKVKKEIDDWVGQTATKTINVVTSTGTNGGSSSDNSSGEVDAVSGATGVGQQFVEGLGNLINDPVGQTVDAVTQLFKDLGLASGGYGIPSGDLFIANEAGAELVGSINGKTSVANQGQIIEGIQRGVAEANSEQNALLRQQNELLRGILEKDNSVRLNASAALGRVARQSLDMYGSMVGG